MADTKALDALRQYKNDRKTDDVAENQRIFDKDEFKELVRAATGKEALTDNEFICGSHCGSHCKNHG